MSDCKRKIIVITHNYPYVQGEESFIEPELKVMMQDEKFDITIISNTSEKGEIKFPLANKVKCEKIIEYSIMKRPLLVIKYCLLYFVSKQIKQERDEILKSEQRLKKRFKE